MYKNYNFSSKMILIYKQYYKIINFYTGKISIGAFYQFNLFRYICKFWKQSATHYPLQIENLSGLGIIANNFLTCELLQMIVVFAIQT